MLDNGALKCWGSGQFGQLGSGDTGNFGDALGEMGDSLPAVAFGLNATTSILQIACGGSHTCAVLTGGRLRCFGHNVFGQLGNNGTGNVGDDEGEMGVSLGDPGVVAGWRVVKVACGWQHTCALVEGGRVLCWGLANVGQAGAGNPLSLTSSGAPPAVDIATGTTHTCVSLGTSVKCLGSGGYGQLCNGQGISWGAQVETMGDALPYALLA